MIVNDLSTVDLSKYKRLFTFGCSFTKYLWPIWADLLSKEMPNAEFFNLGKTGAGQLYISAMVTEANQRYKFGPSDLVVIQWTTYFREDRYLGKYWLTPGNIFTQDVYDASFVKKFACIRGYIIRDLALITMTKHMLNSFASDNIMLTSIPFTVNTGIPVSCDPSDLNVNSNIDDVLVLYEDTINVLQLAMTEVLRPTGNATLFPWPTTITYINDSNKRVKDYHPSTIVYYAYLKKLGFQLTELSHDLAIESEKYTSNVIIRKDLDNRWPMLNPSIL